MGDRRISHKLTGNVLSLCVTLAYLNPLKTMAPIDIQIQQEKIQVCENNLIRRIEGVIEETGEE